MRFDYTSVGGYADLSSPGSPWHVRSGGVKGLGEPDHVEFVQDQALLNGQRFRGFRVGARKLFLPVRLQVPAPQWLTSQRAFWQIFQPDVLQNYGTLRVTQDDGTWREIRCRVAGDGGYTPQRSPDDIGTEFLGVDLVADDPWWQGATITAAFGPQGDALPFFATTSDRVLNILSQNTTGSATLSNPGDVESWATYSIVGPTTDFTVTYRGATLFSSSTPLNSNQRLDIVTDPTQQSVLVSPISGGVSTNFWDQLSVADFYPILPDASTGGSNSLGVVIRGGGSMSVYYKPRYRRAY